VKALHFGAGNIGRGFIGQLLNQSGYEVVFADVVSDLIATINERRRYRVITLGKSETVHDVEGVRGVDLRSSQCALEVLDTDLITTAVGVRNLDSVADVLASGLQQRSEREVTQPLNILACENALNATSLLQDLVMQRVSEGVREYVNQYVGFANVAVDRIAPNIKSKAAEPLDSVVEEFYEWDIEKSGLKGELNIVGATLVHELGPYLERKLFLLNGVHAIVAYMGYAKGYRTIYQAIQDEVILRVARAVQTEVSQGLVHRHAELTRDGLAVYADTIIKRFQNPNVEDQVVRVGRDPMRKLGPNDRLIAPLTRCLEAGCMPHHLLIGIAAAYAYDDPDDPQALELQALIAGKGIHQAIRSVSGIGDDALLQEMVDQYQKQISTHA
jgi:mannitol-1-phosphate 5-dehydrogenase